MLSDWILLSVALRLQDNTTVMPSSGHCENRLISASVCADHALSVQETGDTSKLENAAAAMISVNTRQVKRGRQALACWPHHRAGRYLQYLGRSI